MVSNISMETQAIPILQHCDYLSPDGVKCSRTPYNSEKCIFHTFESRSSFKFGSDFNELIEKKDGNWCGFIYPADFNLENRTIDFSVNMQWSNFNNLNVSKMNFNKDVDFRNSKFEGKIEFNNSNFQSDVNFQNSNFNGVVFNYSTIFHKNTSFYNCNFLGRTQFSCIFKGSVNFNNAIFFDSTIFRGTRSIEASFGDTLACYASLNVEAHTSSTIEDTIIIKIKKNLVSYKNKILESFNLLKSKKDRLLNKVRTKWKAIKLKYQNKSEKISRVFESEVQMQDVDFREPERTRFYMVNFSKAYLAGTNFRGVHLQDILWQKKRGRKVVYDECFLRSGERSFKKYYGSRVEDLYRNLRVAFENNKDFLTASDFYIGEMDIARLRKPLLERYFFSVNALYKYLSNYGTSPVRAFIIFLIMVIIHAVLTWTIVQDNNIVVTAFTFKLPYSRIEVINSYIVNSIKVLTLQRIGSFINFGGWQNILDTLFRIIGPVQLALLVLSLRSKVKRH